MSCDFCLDTIIGEGWKLRWCARSCTLEGRWHVIHTISHSIALQYLLKFFRSMVSSDGMHAFDPSIVFCSRKHLSHPLPLPSYRSTTPYRINAQTNRSHPSFPTATTSPLPSGKPSLSITPLNLSASAAFSTTSTDDGEEPRRWRSEDWRCRIRALSPKVSCGAIIARVYAFASISPSPGKGEDLYNTYPASRSLPSAMSTQASQSKTAALKICVCMPCAWRTRRPSA